MTKPTIHSLHKEHYQQTNEQNVGLILQYSTILKQWKFVNYSCIHCGNTYKGIKHFDSCKELNSIKRRKTFVPIQVVTKNGQRMYRYGDTGKLYADRKDAEKQAAAIMASGYKEKKDMDKK